MLHYILYTSALISVVFTADDFIWNRWEKRTVDCINRNGDCLVIAPDDAIPPRDPKNYKCRREPMPQTSWNTLAQNSTTRIACPLGCEPDFDLSVLQKVPYVNPKCQKYYTYGKYRDSQANDWFIWMTEPCEAAISTHCRFKDVPQGAKSQRKHKQLA
ncbi:unnamed protein product [Auanema sp. JU1783]|nr:unnamed protein product [Auanema sp. JU1783]